ncbi:MogA/MoaB family molybdenum cofactor biosynthesis protein [Halegenticoccus tardaugens]|uniref:MogA/MoaB family molybdenum cofactor biosynthesis protein n=1 Tax=Halegenticoccus tardaugens TaxID=2071624 RepID=UPI00100AC124|nr:MogA/MoaB family molybdenum cofactor biosynthesis protein [Halegenticoccus tardaugens]
MGDARNDETHERDVSDGRGNDRDRDHTADRHEHRHDDRHENDRHGRHDHDHDHHHDHDLDRVGVAVVTVSSTRSMEDDSAGDAIVAAVEADGNDVVTRDLVNDDYDGVQSAVNALVGRDDVDAVVTSGGTGVTPDDVTVEAVRPLFDKELPGFGELFRRLSYEEIGTRVVGTRAVAGVAAGVPVFCLPGSENAARLGAEEIVVEEAGHLAGLAGRADDA